MKQFKSPRHVQRFLATHDQIANVFTRRSNEDTAATFHSARNQAFTTWAEVTCVAMAPKLRLSTAGTHPLRLSSSDIRQLDGAAVRPTRARCRSSPRRFKSISKNISHI